MMRDRSSLWFDYIGYDQIKNDYKAVKRTWENMENKNRIQIKNSQDLSDQVLSDICKNDKIDKVARSSPSPVKRNFNRLHTDDNKQPKEETKALTFKKKIRKSTMTED